MSAGNVDDAQPPHPDRGAVGERRSRGRSGPRWVIRSVMWSSTSGCDDRTKPPPTWITPQMPHMLQRVVDDSSAYEPSPPSVPIRPWFEYRANDMQETQTHPVPFLDLSHVHEPITRPLLDDFRSLMLSGAFTNGPHVAEFERVFAEYCGTAHCVGMASGLDALRLCLLGVGVEPGDEVVVPAMTFIATFEAVSQARWHSCSGRCVERRLLLGPCRGRAMPSGRGREL